MIRDDAELHQFLEMLRMVCLRNAYVRKRLLEENGTHNQRNGMIIWHFVWRHLLNDSAFGRQCFPEGFLDAATSAFPLHSLRLRAKADFQKTIRVKEHSEACADEAE